jgi:hypothetical protein
MITDYYSKTVKRRATETTTEQDTPQDIERLKITPTQYKKTKTKSSIGGPRQAIEKQFQKSKSGTIKKSQSETTNTKKQAADASPDVCMLIARILCEFRRTSRNRRYAPAGRLLRGVWPSIMYNDHAL